VKKYQKMLIHQKEVSDLHSCAYNNWYEDFRKNCIKSHCLQVPDDVLSYLRADFFILPEECKSISGSSSSQNTKVVGEASNFDEDDEEEEKAPSFTEFSNKIKDILKELGK
jgi:hypothetical protein